MKQWLLAVGLLLMVASPAKSSATSYYGGYGQSYSPTSTFNLSLRISSTYTPSYQPQYSTCGGYGGCTGSYGGYSPYGMYSGYGGSHGGAYGGYGGYGYGGGYGYNPYGGYYNPYAYGYGYGMRRATCGGYGRWGGCNRRARRYRSFSLGIRVGGFALNIGSYRRY